MALEVSVASSSGGLEDVFIIGDVLQSIAGLLEPVADGVTIALNTTTKAVQFVEPFAEALDPSAASKKLLLDSMNVIIEKTRKFLTDMRATGVYVLPVGIRKSSQKMVPLTAATPVINFLEDVQNPNDGIAGYGHPGGLQGLKSFIRTALLNARDPSRPNFADTAYIGSMSFFGYGLDAIAAARIAKIVEFLVVFSDENKRAALLENFDRDVGKEANDDINRIVGPFADAFTVNRLANTARDVAPAAWIHRNLNQLLPRQVEDGFIIADQFLVALQRSLGAIQNVISRLVKMLVKALHEIQATLQAIKDLISFLDLLLEHFPVVTMFSSPQSGGTLELANSLDEWFDSAIHQELKEIKDTSYTVGFMLVYGTSDSIGADSIKDVLDNFFAQPGA